MKIRTSTSVTVAESIADDFVGEDYIVTKSVQGQISDSITLLMGQPATAPCLIPVLHASTPSCTSDPFMVDGECYMVTAMSFGSAHGAVFVDDVDDVDVETVGAALGSHPLFPNGASIVFIEALDRERFKARLWQRGVGEMDYTPEAASVAGAAAVMLQKTLDITANVSMGGEDFCVTWDRCGDGVSLMGPSVML
ncbi:MAG: hypothetical protein FWB97_07890 [Oscillospiraceae bacterium]|nr:hypothetical protein [Oscillospiraceae bacterium]